MNRFKGNPFARLLAILAVAVLIVTSVNLPAKADEDGPILGPGGENPCGAGHDLYVEYIIQDPTCESSGVVQYKCSRCNYTEERNEPGPLGHEPDGGDFHDSTCTEDGYITFHCVRCGTDMGTDIVPAKGHQRNDGMVVEQPTCQHDGKIVYACSVCGASMGEDTIPAVAHTKDGGTVVEQATCQHGGKIAYKCSVCGASMGEDTTPAIDHVSDGGTIVKKPTTTEPGEIEYKCTMCGKVLKEEQIPVIEKRSTPQAVFDTASCNLTNVPENSTVKLNGTVISATASGEVSLKNRFPQTGDYTITVIANATDTKGESDPQSLKTHKPAAPSHIQTVPEPSKGGSGAIGGVDTSMEYSLADQDSWFTCASSSQPVSAGIYIVRYKATTSSVASDSIEALVKKEDARKPDKPNANFDGASHQLRNLSAGMSYYSTNGGDTWTKANDPAISLSDDQVNQAVSYKEIRVKNIVDNVESDIQSTPVGRVSQPSGVYTKAATNGDNGEIKGVGRDMEYRMSGHSTWHGIDGDKVKGLSKGKYYVRRKATGCMIESNPVDVEIKDTDSSKEGTPSASFNGYNMHIDGVSNCRISFDGGKTWTDKIKDTTYVASEKDVNTAYGLIIYRVGGDSTSDSDRQYISLTKQATPAGITATSATPTVPGMIVGTDASMQYRSADISSWVDITTNTVPVAAGTYYLRRHGYGNSLPSDWLTVVIKASTNVTPSTPTNVIPVENNLPKKEEAKKEEPKKEEQKPEETPDDKKVEETIEKEEAALEEEPTSVNGEKGWEAIEATFEAATEPVIIELNNATQIPAEVFEKAAETNTPLVLTANTESVWSIRPEDVNVNDLKALGSINLGIVDNTTTIPTDALASVEDQASEKTIAKTFDIKHEGNFGFKANLTMKVSGNPGDYANLYWYNTYKGVMEFVDSSVINDKNEATFAMSHASSYAVVTSKVAMSQADVKEVAVSEVVKADNSSEDKTAAVTSSDSASTQPAKKISAVTIVLIIFIIALVCALVAVLYIQKRKEELRRKHHHNSDNHKA